MENSSNISLKTLSSDEIDKIEEFRKSKQTAVLVILFSDVVNSTYATETFGDQTYSKLRHIHDELFKRIMCREKAGIIIKEVGDSFLCVFAEPSTAVLRAIEFQRAIHSNKEHLTIQDYTLTVKIGIHVGQVTVENTLALDIFGRHVNRTARIEAIANGGQILTSQSIWENAVGWLKDNNEENIGWISYGKTKLKGIEERVELFGFYSKEIGSPPAPKIFRKQKQNRILLILTAILVLAGLSAPMLKRISQENDNRQTASMPIGRKSYYIQFDFTEFAKPSNNNFSKYAPDTLALQENFTQQAIAVLYPDSIITEADLIELYIKKGIPYTRHDVQDFEYFQDSLHLSGQIFFKVGVPPASIFNLKERDPLDSILLETDYVIGNSASQSINGSSQEYLSKRNISNDFRKELQNISMSAEVASWQGYVLDYKDSTVLFRLEKSPKIRKGASIKINRQYRGKKGWNNLLENIQEEIDFYENKPRYSEELNKAIKLFSVWKMNTLNENSTTALEITGKGNIIEVYDSTGIAIFKRNGIVPWDIPRKGDLIWLTY